MRVACLFDIHGNLPALEAVLAEPDVAGADVVLSGGDAVSGPFPRETAELLRGLGDRLLAIRGNTEDDILAAEEAKPAWCAAQLGADHLAWIDAQPLTAELGDGVLACHGTPRSDLEIVTLVTPDERLAEILTGVDARVVIGGHTHSQMDRVVSGIRWVNAGSVGMPYEHEQGAYWALVEDGEVDLRRTGYDAEAAAERVRATAMPGADEFAAEYVLTQYPPEETAPFFERMAGERGGTL
jgi:predicted phosphodiesterase